MPHEPANLNLDLALIGEAFVVVVVGGMGSIPGAFVAAVLIAMVKAFCIAAGSVRCSARRFPLSKLTLVAEFLVMAVVLVWRRGACSASRRARCAGRRRWSSRSGRCRRLAPGRLGGARGAAARRLPRRPAPYAVVLMIDVLIAGAVRRQPALPDGPAGMHSFGHAAYFGLGAYGAALCVKAIGLPMEASLLLAPLLAALGAFVFGWFCVRLVGVYLAMLTLAFAQIVWSVVFQWDALTGGSNGLVGIWPAPWLAPKPAVLPAGARLHRRRAAACWCGCCTRRSAWPCAPAATRRSAPRRSASPCRACSGSPSSSPGTVAASAGALFAFAKGTISPETLGVGKSVDGLVMVLLGGVHAVSGPWAGAALFTWLQDTVARQTDYWRALLGIAMLALVLVFPLGVAGGLKRLFIREAVPS
jgi:branched-chain amino acid transport system permease protein